VAIDEATSAAYIVNTNDATVSVLDLATVPEAPVVTSSSSGVGSVTVNWSAPSTGGAALTNYVVAAAPAAGAPTTLTVGPSQTSATITGLANNTTYAVTVTAENSRGSGGASTPVSLTTTNVTVPGAPTIISSSVASKSVTVTWSAPTSDGHNPISSYVVDVATPSSDRTVTVASTSRSATVTNLTNGASYTVTVWAVNGIGRGAASLPLVLIPSAVPSAPSLTKVVGAKGTLTLTWKAPTTNGGTPVTAYQVFVGSKAGGESLIPAATVTTTTVQLKGQKKGTYFVVVRARNAAGLSPASNQKSAVVS
jgi:hypothetical protein